MDWSSPDRAAAYKLFKQKVLMYFDCKDVATKKQVSHVLSMTCDEGVHMYNSCGLTGDDTKDQVTVQGKIDTNVEPKSSFRIERLTFQCMH